MPYIQNNFSVWNLSSLPAKKYSQGAFFFEPICKLHLRVAEFSWDMGWMWARWGGEWKWEGNVGGGGRTVGWPECLQEVHVS